MFFGFLISEIWIGIFAESVFLIPSMQKLEDKVNLLTLLWYSCSFKEIQIWIPIGINFNLTINLVPKLVSIVGMGFSSLKHCYAPIWIRIGISSNFTTNSVSKLIPTVGNRVRIWNIAINVDPNQIGINSNFTTNLVSKLVDVLAMILMLCYRNLKVLLSASYTYILKPVVFYILNIQQGIHLKF